MNVNFIIEKNFINIFMDINIPFHQKKNKNSTIHLKTIFS